MDILSLYIQTKKALTGVTILAMSVMFSLATAEQSQSDEYQQRVLLKIQKIQLEDRVELDRGTEYLNCHERCIVCGCERGFDIKTKMVEPLIGHHVKYFPAIVAWVHYHCHKKIHDNNNPIISLIQYEGYDSRKYYGQKTALHYEESR